MKLSIHSPSNRLSAPKHSSHVKDSLGRLIVRPEAKMRGLGHDAKNIFNAISSRRSGFSCQAFRILSPHGQGTHIKVDLHLKLSRGLSHTP